MRIISGKHKGRKIRAPFIKEIRPTTDFAKTGLFNVLNNHIDFENCKVLDLCSGFGSIAFEFASRGAMFVDAIDIHPQAIKFIRQFAQSLNLPVNTYQMDVIQFLNRVQQKYDVIFADPPYENAYLLDEILNLVKNRNLLSENGILVLEHNKGFSFARYSGFFDERKYGKVHFSFFEW